MFLGSPTVTSWTRKVKVDSEKWGTFSNPFKGFFGRFLKKIIRPNIFIRKLRLLFSQLLVSFSSSEKIICLNYSPIIFQPRSNVVGTNELFVGGLNPSCKEKALQELFLRFGEVKKCWLVAKGKLHVFKNIFCCTLTEEWHNVFDAHLSTYSKNHLMWSQLLPKRDQKVWFLNYLHYMALYFYSRSHLWKSSNVGLEVMRSSTSDPSVPFKLVWQHSLLSWRTKDGIWKSLSHGNNEEFLKRVDDGYLL